MKKADPNFASGIVWLVAPLSFFAFTLSCLMLFKDNIESNTILEKLFKSTELWAAIIGTIVGALIAAHTTYRIAAMQEFSQRKFAAKSIQLKLLDIMSHIALVRESLEETFHKAESQEPRIEPWQAYFPIGNRIPRIEFSMVEKMVIVGIGDAAAINATLGMDKMNNTIIDLVELSRDLRTEIEDMLLRNKQIDGPIFEVNLTKEEFQAIRPKCYKLNIILQDSLDTAREYDIIARDSLDKFGSAVQKKYMEKISYNIQDDRFPFSRKYDHKNKI